MSTTFDNYIFTENQENPTPEIKKKLYFHIKGKHFHINVKPISIKDYLLFEEKKVEPGSKGDTPNSIGLTNAIRWFFPLYLEVETNYTNKQPLTVEFMTQNEFEEIHLIVIMGNLTKVTGNVTINDDANEVSYSDDFTYNGYTIKRKKISWSETPKFLQLQNKNRDVNIFKMNLDFIKRYFTINDEIITNEDLENPDKMPLNVYLLMVERLGKFLKQLSQ